MSKMHLFSEVHGVVVEHGIPVAGAVVEQEFRWHWTDEVGKTRVSTDASGRFAFAAVVRSSLLGSLLPHEPRVQQTLLIKHGGKVFKAWMMDKGDYLANSELGGKPIDLVCDLSVQPSRKGAVYGICEFR